MPLTQRENNKFTDTIHLAFDKIGRNGGQKPVFTDNRDAYAWEMHVAKLLESRADKRRKEALQAAVSAGLAPDTSAVPQDIGERVLFVGDNMTLSLKVSERSLGVDYTMFAKLLQENGVSPRVIADCLNRSQRPKAKQHQFSATPVVD